MEHLETDVMRFMAILAFCLVAIFALVQSVPQQVAKVPKRVPDTAISTVSPADSPVPQRPAEPPSEPAAEPAPERVRQPLPEPAPQPAPPPEPVSQPQSAAATPESPPEEPALPTPAPQPQPEAAPPTPSAEPQPGFSLRFDSDAALVGLVERGEVALYAFAREQVWRFMIVDGRPAFRSADRPGQVHEMAPDTVPGPVLDALRRSVVLPGGGLRWGVTLPPPTAAALGRVLATNDGGELVIDADGFLRLEDPS